MTSPDGADDDKPLISVVVPAYNAEGYIRPTLRSVLAQSHANVEAIVVDDGSRDATTAVVEEMAREDPRIRLVRLASNYGAPAGPRNVGVREARGEWIAFLDSDDIWHPDKLKLQLDALSASGARFCSSQMMDFEDERALVFTSVANPETRDISFLSLLIKPRVPTSSIVVAKDLVRRYPFNEDMRYKAREDFDCWLHCHEEIRRSVKIQHPLVGYRVSPQQISGNKWKMVGRHFHVLKEYRFRSGRKLGLGAVLFTFTHFALSYYYRLVLKEL